ncbi:DUF2141 domain-containing protein [Jannaschia sp. LMIT008]|uniref:DUF2141 domain-containing protein n=1 Tax=Jannaschia maritima TaxID=3032585 RepID=UPI002811023B|nr:DUF2141 domain-containing protein [Jannaschia sp. LMIT008]
MSGLWRRGVPSLGSVGVTANRTIRACTGAALWLAACIPAAAGQVQIEVKGLRSGEGLLRAALCTRDEFLTPRCGHAAAVPAAAPLVTIDGVGPGTYAVQVFHDEDSDGQLDRMGFLPQEGLGFSRNARMLMGPPRFEDAAFGLPDVGAVRITMTMRYFP